MVSLLSVSHSPWKFNIIFPIQVSMNVAIIATLCKSDFSDTLLSLAPVPVNKVPYLALFALIQIWILTKIVVALGVANFRKHGFDNTTPHQMNTAEYMGDSLYKLQSTHENTLEAIVVAMAAAVVASNTNLDTTIVAKFNFLARVTYPLLYVLGPNMVHSIVFTFGLFSSVLTIIYRLFPELISSS